MMSKNMIKLLNIYSTSFWKLIQKLFKSKGEAFLLVGKMMMVILLVVGKSEGRAQEVEALRVGDYVPKDFWNQKVKIYNQGDTSVIELSKYRGKSLLIDFWASWCGYCVQGFPKLVEIQEGYRNHLNILLVNSSYTKDTFNKIHTMRNAILRENDLTTAFMDDYFIQLFPHGPIPHYVWINPKGRIAGITFREFVNERMMEEFINKNLKNENIN